MPSQPDPEIVRAAQFLASHAVLLLGVGVVAVLAAIAAMVLAVRAIARFRQPLLDAFSAGLRLARTAGGVDRALSRASALVPSAYVALHLGFGLALAAAATAFAAIAEEVVSGGEMAAFDLAFAAALQDGRTEEWERFFSTVSMLGSRNVLAAASLGVAIALLWAGRIVLAVAWITAQAGGGLLNLALKAAFERTRPEFADPLLASTSWSFPSGHAMGTFILFGLGTYLLAREYRSWTAACVTAGVAAAWCLTMAFSRLYLGVHYASDVIAGLVAGAAWIAVCASALEVLRRTGGRLRPIRDPAATLSGGMSAEP